MIISSFKTITNTIKPLLFRFSKTNLINNSKEYNKNHSKERKEINQNKSNESLKIKDNENKKRKINLLKNIN